MYRYFLQACMNRKKRVKFFLSNICLLRRISVRKTIDFIVDLDASPIAKLGLVYCGYPPSRGWRQDGWTRVDPPELRRINGGKAANFLRKAPKQRWSSKKVALLPAPQRTPPIDMRVELCALAGIKRTGQLMLTENAGVVAGKAKQD
ncbi:uncharacterized protein LOC111268353 isoform X1 [Varroa jacobsoni]|uniref:uncharacterized protein LOC111268353 isoform X1 n=1 Tax=Varroa jacobsoni TaxID=62625 RepID=UPI000BF7FFAC|nr:uncharacterized protein LOC111268353 isoform X1 [Varroa jacobsoni]